MIPVFSYAAGSGSMFDTSSCNILNIVMGTPGKVFAAFAVVSTGFGFFSGKISWGLCVGVVGGIAVIFGAPSVVSAISGKPMFACQQGVQYVSTCDVDNCYSCPMGFTGDDCDECAIGYVGINCDSCEDGYTGYNCSQCDASKGYYKSGKYCDKACIASVEGVLPNTVVGPADSPASVECNADGFSGSIQYTCINEIFEVVPGSVCGCEGNRIGASCDQCEEGYDIADNCNSVLPGYYMIDGEPKPKCDISGESIIGVDAASVGNVLPEAGILGCTIEGYTGQIDYTCVDGVFGYSGQCGCDMGYAGPVNDCAASCADGYNKDNGACKRICTIPAQDGLIGDVQVDSGSNSFLCNDSDYYGTIDYSCNDGVLSGVVNNCLSNLCSGGEEINIGTGKIHIFRSDSELKCNGSTVDGAQILVVAGGGSGGSHDTNNGNGGGGGGAVIYVPSVTLDRNYNISVGAGGLGVCKAKGNNGEMSKFVGGSILLKANGGGGGGGYGNSRGNVGGSTGGTRCGVSANDLLSSITDGVENAQTYGNLGGDSDVCSRGGGGGGGALSAGSSGATGGPQGGNGGQGISFNISGSNVVYGSGGGGASTGSLSVAGGVGGTNASDGNTSNDAVPNTGAGTGGNNGRDGGYCSGNASDGIVIIRY